MFDESSLTSPIQQAMHPLHPAGPTICALVVCSRTERWLFYFIFMECVANEETTSSVLSVVAGMGSSWLPHTAVWCVLDTFFILRNFAIYFGPRHTKHLPVLFNFPYHSATL